MVRDSRRARPICCEVGGACGPATRRPELRFGRVGELDVIHDDEAVEEGHEAGTGRGCFDEESFRFGEDRCVALDAALGVQDEVVGCPGRLATAGWSW